MTNDGFILQNCIPLFRYEDAVDGEFPKVLTESVGLRIQETSPATLLSNSFLSRQRDHLSSSPSGNASSFANC